MKKVRFALMGCGRISRKHVEALVAGVPNAELVAVCDIQYDRAQAVHERHGIPAFPDLKSMMVVMGSNIDVVSVLTPSGCHAENAIEVASYGKHVVVEKPMALAMEDAEAMVEACERAGVRLFVVKQNRYNTAVQRLRDAIQRGRFGKLVMATARVRWCRTQKYYDQDAWRGTWLAGDVDSVFSYTKRQLVDIEAEDTGVCVMKFRCGALGIVEATTATRPIDLEASITIMGEHGTVEIGGFAVNEIKTWKFAKAEPGDDELLSSTQTPPDVYGFGHHEYLRHVAQTILEGGPAAVDGIEGMKSLRLINAMYESSERGEEVQLRFTPKRARLGQRDRARRRDDPVYNVNVPRNQPSPATPDPILKELSADAPPAPAAKLVV